VLHLRYRLAWPFWHCQFCQAACQNLAGSRLIL
jgi:hypothetical protein